MKGFKRDDPLISLCGLNCGLCTMYIGGYCPGCGGGDGNQSCAIARCSVERKVAFCSACADYPCDKYDGIDDYDSFISTRNRKSNLDKVERIGPAAYRAGLDEKMAILQVLLADYNDGRHKSPFCTAVNLLDLDALRAIMATLPNEMRDRMTPKEKAKLAETKFQAAADRQGISLNMRKKK